MAVLENFPNGNVINNVPKVNIGVTQQLIITELVSITMTANIRICRVLDGVLGIHPKDV